MSEAIFRQHPKSLSQSVALGGEARHKNTQFSQDVRLISEEHECENRHPDLEIIPLLYARGDGIKDDAVGLIVTHAPVGIGH